MPLPKLCLATRNRHKVEELADALQGKWTVVSLAEYGELPEVEETAQTFLGNAQLKAESISARVPDFVLADDSGLEVDALGGDPGVRSARYAGRHGDDAANNARLLENLVAAGAMKDEQRAGRFRCVLALAQGGKTLASFEGSCEGRIGLVARGEHGFGYDPLFIPTGIKETLAQVGPEMKARISHRAEALRKFAEWKGVS